MASGFPGGGADFYGTAGIGGSGSVTTISNVKGGQYRSQQLGGILVDPSSPMVPRSADFFGKRSIAEMERQHQQQQGPGVFLRSVKQRSYQHTSPISPLSSVDFSPYVSPEVSSFAASAASNFSGRNGLPLFQPIRSQHISLNNVHTMAYNSDLTSFNFAPNPPVVMGSEPESEKKMRNRLQELEKQLLDDNDEGDTASVITNSEWSETMQSLINPGQKTLSPSPTSSSSSSSSSSPTSASSKQSLVDAAAAIAEGNFDVASANLARLEQFSNARGDPEQRLTAYMVSALRSRLNRVANPAPVMELCSNDHMIATQMLYEASPCFKLGFMAANLAILEASRDQPNNNLHVVDFDIGQGSQYMTLIHALGSRQSGKPTVIKITTVTDPNNRNESGLRIVGDRLRTLADRVGVGLKFSVVSRSIADLNRDSLGCDANEALAVNFAFRLYRMPDESVSTENPRDQLLRCVKGLSPCVVTLVEQEMNANTAPFMARVSEACAYYRALFDSLDATMSRDGAERAQVEECLARKAANSVACEGRDRVERCEMFGKWRARLGMAGFEPVPVGPTIAEYLRDRLGSVYPNNPGFTIKEEAGGVSFGWMGRSLTVASAWR